MWNDRVTASSLALVLTLAALFAQTADLALVLGSDVVRVGVSVVVVTYALFGGDLSLVLLTAPLCAIYLRVRVGDGAKSSTVSSAAPSGEGGSASVVAGLPGDVLTVGVPSPSEGMAQGKA